MKASNTSSNLLPVTSSSTAGFFQKPPPVRNQFYDDVVLHRIFQLYLPSEIRDLISGDLSDFGARVLTREVIGWISDAERNPPYLRTWDTWGKRQDELVTSEGWRKLQELGLSEGIVAIAYEEKFAQYDRLYQFFKYHLWTGSCANVTCPSAMQDGAAALLLRQLRNSKSSFETRPVFESAYAKLTSRNPRAAWTSGQWMTERPGGSDVSNTETRATLVLEPKEMAQTVASDGSPLGPWLINGFKWFSSATDANMTIMLAKTGPSDRISTFFAPTRRIIAASSSASEPRTISTKPNTELNGIQIQRLKSKLGTHPLPTAELVLDGVRAHMIGIEGQGTKEISTILNITRVHNAVTSVGLFGRALGISRAFARVRKTSGRLLMDVPSHVKGLAQQHVDYRANMMLAYFVVALLGTVEHSARLQPEGPKCPSRLLPTSIADASNLLRVLTPTLKALSALSSIAGLRHCMESLGGVGYLENDDQEVNIARLFRDANVLSIWEGTTDVMASDLVRVLKGNSKGNSTTEAFTILNKWILGFVSHWHGRSMGGGVGEGLQESLRGFATMLSDQWKIFRTLITVCPADELRYRGQEVLRMIGWSVCVVLLVEDAFRDEDEVSLEIAGRWIRAGGAVGWGTPVKSVDTNVDLHFGIGTDWKKNAIWDRRIVFENRADAEVSEMAKL